MLPSDDEMLHFRVVLLLVEVVDVLSVYVFRVLQEGVRMK